MSAIHEAYDLAEFARNEFEQGRVSPVILEAMYADYNPEVEDVAEFVRSGLESFSKGNTEGACGLASLYLIHLYSKAKLDHGIPWQGSYYDLKTRQYVNHTFALMNTVGKVDITADQFQDGPRVSVGPVEFPWSYTDNLHRVVRVPMKLAA
jgi:hypothetical protein